jgi:hypothetical protein
MISLEQVLGYDLAFISGDGSQWRTCTRRRVAGGVDSRI